jgi:hypothetical protein
MRAAADDFLATRLRVNAASEIRVLTQTYSARCSVHIRQYVLNDEDTFVPTSKGVTLPVDRLGELLEAVRELRTARTVVGTIAVIEKNEREEVRFSVTSWQGTTRADIRTYFAHSASPERRPGKGVRFNLALLPELERALEVLDDAVRRGQE